MTPVAVLIVILAALVAIPVGIVGLIYLIVPVFRAVGWVFRQVFRFIGGMLGDALRLLGIIITSAALAPLTVFNVLIGRWSATAHYGRALGSELTTILPTVYRLLFGHLARLLCLTALTEGIERRLPSVVAHAPGSDRPSRAAGQFEGYRIIGSLQGGGSGGKLYIAEPTREKLAALGRHGAADALQVVIKSFSLRDGSSLPQIVREGRALDAAKRLGLILEHDLSDDRFHYVMRYVPGDPLTLVTGRLHAASGPEGLGPRQLAGSLDYGADLLRTLCHYHAGGLWHKDVKPDNIIVAGGQAHLVDFGLITPLRSAMTLTTHGTEYFRDPEMVRMALKGVKVHEVDGAKFDLYAAGAVLYSMIEGQFPAHGGLSQISKRCPETIRWIVRRAMTDYDKRYETAAAMLADLEAVAAATDPFALRPVDLPSVRGAMAPEPAPVAVAGAAVGGTAGSVAGSVAMGVGAAAAAAAPGWAAVGSPATPAGVGRLAPRIQVTDWWRGRYASVGEQPGAAAAGAGAGAGMPGAFAPSPARATFARREGSGPAHEQRRRAQARAEAARKRAQERMRGHGRVQAAGLNAGVLVALLLFLMVCAGVVALVLSRAVSSSPPEGVDFVLSTDLEDKPDAAATPLRHGPGRTVTVAHGPRSDAPGKVFIVHAGGTLDRNASESISGRLAQLVQHGFTLEGDLPGTAQTDAQRERSVLPAATLLKAVGISPLESPETTRAVREWLGEHPDLQMVLWIGRGDHGETTARLIRGPGIPDGVAERATSALRG